MGFVSYLSNRKQLVCIDSCKSVLQDICGMPQRSVILGPLLFLVYINDIHNSITVSSVKLFANDTNLFIHSKTISEAFHKVNESVKLLSVC